MAETVEEVRARGGSLEEIVQAKFRRLSTDELIARIHNAPDFGYDDESVELTRRCEANGQAWHFVEGRGGKCRVEIYNQADALTLNIKLQNYAGLTWGDVLDADEGRETAAKLLRRDHLTQEQYDDAVRRINEWEAGRKAVAA